MERKSISVINYDIFSGINLTTRIVSIFRN